VETGVEDRCQEETRKCAYAMSLASSAYPKANVHTLKREFVSTPTTFA